MKKESKKIEVKSWVEEYEQLISNRDFDIRKNDKDYQVGDVVTFREYDHEKNEYTGRWIDVLVKYVHTGPIPCLLFPGNMCVFQFVSIRNESREKSHLRVFEEY